MSALKKYQPNGPKDPTKVYQILTHGGVGDCLWVLRKLQNADRPVFVHIAEENRHRPRRSGQVVDALKCVEGWTWAGRTFHSSGDWGPPDDPANAIDKTWAEIKPKDGYILRLECNRHLESGKRLEDWLPDLPTTHHLAFDPVDQPTVRLRDPYVVVHLAGWPDVPDAIWVNAINLFKNLAYVYVIGGSYDHRPRQIFNLIRGSGVSLIEDAAWPDLYALVNGCHYCMGHASGLTILADVLRKPGVVVNPRSLPKLVGTWNSPENPGLIHVADAEDFREAVYHVYQRMAGDTTSTWPPTAPRGKTMISMSSDPLDAVAAAAAEGPNTAAVWYAARTPHKGLGRALVRGALDAGRRIRAVAVMGSDTEAADVLIETMRTTKRPALEMVEGPWPGPLRQNTYELIVVNTPDAPADAAAAVSAAWKNVALGGTLVFGGGAAKAAAQHTKGVLKSEPAQVVNCPGWYYLHRRA